MSSTTPTTDLTRFDISPERGFLPPNDPLQHLPDRFADLESLAAQIPKLLVSDQLRARIERLNVPPVASLAPGPEAERAMLLLSYLGHAYVWGGAPEPPSRLPASLAVPWYDAAVLVGRPPVLSYASYALHNWRRLDAFGPIALGNIALLQNFGGGVDEEWFILVHVDIEAKAATALGAVLPAQEAVSRGDARDLTTHLLTVADALDRMYATLGRMPEFCDPYVYYNRVRPYIHGWKNQPTLPHGLIYDGVAAYGGKAQQFRGETGAQSSIIPTMDGLLGVSHAPGVLRDYLMEMRDYMPPRHRAFIEHVERGPHVREFVTGQRDGALRDAYDRCVGLVEQFRAKHLEYAARYIFQQARQDPSNPTDIGTGGTPFMPYLKKHRDETALHRLSSS